MTKKIQNILDSNLHLFSASWIKTNRIILEDRHLNTLLKVGNKILMEASRNFELESKKNSQHFFRKKEIIQYKSSLSNLIKDRSIKNIKQWILSLEQLDISDILLLMGQKTSSTSLVSIEALPPSEKILTSACNAPYNTFINQIEKQLDKHVGRGNNSFWPKLEGNSYNKKDHIKELIDYFLNHIDWWNTYCHYHHNYVFEIRIESGYGMRWSKNGEHFIGFLEPYVSFKNKS